jgi:hypothetical protein
MGAAISCVLAAWRFGGVGDEYVRAPRRAAGFVMRLGVLMRETLYVMRSVISADIALRPALVRIRDLGPQVRDPIGVALSPGSIVIFSDAEGALVHVLDEGGEAMTEKTGSPR